MVVDEELDRLFHALADATRRDLLRRSADGELVFTKSMLGRYPEPDDVIPLIDAKIAG